MRRFPVRTRSRRDKRSVVYGLTNLRLHLKTGPLIIEEGEGVWVTDNTGRRYIEGMSGLWCVSLGFSQRRLVEAARRQMERLPYYHLTNHRGHAPVVDLAEKLLAHAGREAGGGARSGGGDV